MLETAREQSQSQRAKLESKVSKLKSSKGKTRVRKTVKARAITQLHV